MDEYRNPKNWYAGTRMELKKKRLREQTGDKGNKISVYIVVGPQLRCFIFDIYHFNDFIYESNS